MRWLLAILEMVLTALLPVLREELRDSAEDARRQPELRDRLRRRVWNTWGKASLVLSLALFLPGCATHTVYVPHGEPVRLRETIPGAKVWVLDETGQPIAGRMDLPEGWYCLPVPDDDEPR